MAKVTVAGNAIVITSEMKLEEIKMVEKYRPDALVLKGGEDGKEEIFRVAISRNGNGSVNKNGAEFATESHDEAKKATITLLENIEEGDVKEFIADNIGTAILNLNKIEESLPRVINEINTERAQIMANISVI